MDRARVPERVACSKGKVPDKVGLCNGHAVDENGSVLFYTYLEPQPGACPLHDHALPDGDVRCAVLTKWHGFFEQVEQPCVEHHLKGSSFRMGGSTASC